MEMRANCGRCIPRAKTPEVEACYFTSAEKFCRWTTRCAFSL